MLYVNFSVGIRRAIVHRLIFAFVDGVPGEIGAPLPFQCVLLQCN